MKETHRKKVQGQAQLSGEVDPLRIVQVTNFFLFWQVASIQRIICDLMKKKNPLTLVQQEGVKNKEQRKKQNKTAIPWRRI